MPDTAFRESTAPLLRPHQVEKQQSELRRLEGILSAPPHIQGMIQDRGEIQKQHRRVKGMVESQTPKPYAAGEKDAAAARLRDLEGQIGAGMLSHAEMRRNPAGAVDRHRKWERRNKKAIEEAKNIKLRFHATGDDPDRLDDERDVANIDYLRPETSRMNLDVTQIAGKDIHVPSGATRAENIKNVMSDGERDDEAAALLALAQRLADAGNPVGIRTLAALQGKAEPVEKPKKARRQLSPEARAVLLANLAKGRMAKRQAPVTPLTVVEG